MQKKLTLSALLAITSLAHAGGNAFIDSTSYLSDFNKEIATSACTELSGTMEDLTFEYSTKINQLNQVAITKTASIDNICKTSEFIIKFAFDSIIAERLGDDETARKVNVTANNNLATLAMAAKNKELPKNLQPVLLIINTDQEGLQRNEAILAEAAKQYNVAYQILTRQEGDSNNFLSNVRWARHLILADTRGKKAETAEQAKDRATAQLNIADEALTIAYDKLQQNLITQSAYDAAALNQAAKQTEYEYQLNRHITEYEAPKPAILYSSTSSPRNTVNLLSSVTSTFTLWVDTDSNNTKLENLNFSIPEEKSAQNPTAIDDLTYLQRTVVDQVNNSQAIFDMALILLDSGDVQFSLTSNSAGAGSWIKVLDAGTGTPAASILGFDYTTTANGSDPVYVPPEQRVITEVKPVTVIKEVEKKVIITEHQNAYNEAVTAHYAANLAYYKSSTHKQDVLDRIAAEQDVINKQNAFNWAEIDYQQAAGTPQRQAKRDAKNAAWRALNAAKAARLAATTKANAGFVAHQVLRDTLANAQTAYDNAKRAYDQATQAVQDGLDNGVPPNQWRGLQNTQRIAKGWMDGALIVLNAAKAPLKEMDDLYSATMSNLVLATSHTPEGIKRDKLLAAVTAKTKEMNNLYKIYEQATWIWLSYEGCTYKDWCDSWRFREIPWSKATTSQAKLAPLDNAYKAAKSELATLTAELVIAEAAVAALKIIDE